MLHKSKNKTENLCNQLLTTNKFQNRVKNCTHIETYSDPETSLSSEDSNIIKILPDLSTLVNDESIELKQRNSELQLELDSAHMEIEKLILEKQELQKEVDKLAAKTKRLLMICSSNSPKK
ncbi:unnamed protein product [Parnassius apollo]|uniref:(apollo) hypothetical protein n=1 Tax=Parnassius apollo TaxID=110799 RepID=A0A8S3Y9F8_PARAO|nr:unnamed protein product [Parnassius apollo]